MTRIRPHIGVGSVVHVYARAAGGVVLFDRTEHYDYFIERVRIEVEEGNILVIGFALLRNHFHLLIVLLKGTLGEVMSRISAPYVRFFNRTKGDVGQKIAKPYGATKVEDNWHLNVVWHYVDFNPQGHRVVVDARKFPRCTAFFHAQGVLPDFIDLAWAERLVGAPYGNREVWARAYNRVCVSRITSSQFELLELRDERLVTAKAVEFDLFTKSPDEIRDWLGVCRASPNIAGVTLPFVTMEDLSAAVEALRIERGEWGFNSGKRWVDLWSVVLTGLSVFAAGLKKSDVAKTLAISPSGVGRRVRRFQAMLGDSDFVDVVFEVLAAACAWLQTRA
jgi:hypothetical protein